MAAGSTTTVDTHGRWPYVAAALLLPTWALAAARREQLARDGVWVAALGLPILLGHQTEEWFRPGGFLPFCNERLLGSDKPTWPLTERDGLHINVTIGWTTAAVATALWRRSPVVAAVLLWDEAGNAIMHAGMALRERRYNPGLATAVLLMSTHAAAGAGWLARSGRLSRRGRDVAAAAGIALGAGMPLTLKLRQRRARARC